MQKGIVKTNKGSTFAPATAHKFLEIQSSLKKSKREFIFKKRLKKLVGKEKAMYFCTPLNKQSYLTY